jgi:hypothetical protein
LPCHSDLRDLMCFEELSDVCFMHLIRHAKIAAWIKTLLFQEEAVGAVQVAGRPRRLGHDVKCSGKLIQCHLSNIECSMPLIIILPVSNTSKNPETVLTAFSLAKECKR